jgi:DNA-binding transcriptional LysR family regulator
MMTLSAPLRSIEWSDLEVVLAICRTGSLSGAGRLLGNNHSTVFRKVNAIEKRLGVRLFERLPTGYEMTEAGEAAMHYAERIENEVCACELDLFGRDLQLHGKIRIGMGEGLAVLVFAPLLAEFQRINPGVSIDVVSSVENTDLSRREVDIAIRATNKPSQSIVGRYIGDFEFAVYAAPSYLDRAGKRDLKDHDWAVPYVVMDWLVPMIWKNREEGYKRCAFTSNSVLASIEAVAAGMGLSLIAAAFAEGDERLVRLTDPIDHLTRQLWILMHPDLRRNARITALTRFLAEKLNARKSMFIAGKADTNAPADP